MMPGRIAASCEFQTFLRRCRRRFQMHHLLRGLAAVFLAAVIGAGLLLLWDFFRPVSGPIRLAGVVAVLLVTVWTAVRCVLLPIFRGISDEELGAAVDLAAPELDEAVATLVSVEDTAASAEESGSVVMREALWKRTQQHLERAEAAVMDPRTTVRLWIPAVVSGLIVLVLLLVDPAVSAILLKRLFDPLGNHETASRLTFRIVSPGSVAERGSDVRFAAVPVWRSGADQRPPEQAVLLVKTEDGHVDEIPMRYQSGKGQYTASLRGVSRNLLWRIQAGRAATRQFRLHVVSIPQIADAVLRAKPPKYSGRPEHAFPEAAGIMDVLAGSRVSVVLKCREPVAAARLQWLVSKRPDEKPFRERADRDSQKDADGPPVDRLPFQLSADGREARLEFVAAQSGLFRLVLTDEHGLESRDETRRFLNVSADRPPAVRLSGLASVDAARPDDVLVLQGEAEDDVGLAAVELHVRRGAEQTHVIPANALERGDRGVDDRFRIDLSRYPLAAGDAVELQLRAVDVHEPESHEAWSDVITVMVNPDADPPGTSALSQDTRELIERLEDARRELSRDLQQVRRLQQHSHDEWEASGSVRAQRQSEEEQVVGRQLSETAERMAHHPLMRSPAGQVRQLSEMLRHVTAGHLQRAAQQTAETAADDLQQAEQQLADARKQLRTIIDDLRDIGKLEQDLVRLKRLADQAAQLADDAADLQNRPSASEGDAAAETADTGSTDMATQKIEQRRRQLQNGLAELLTQQEAIREAAEQAVRERLQQAADQAGMLADRQRRIREGTQQDAAGDTTDGDAHDSSAADGGLAELSPAAEQTLRRVQELAEAAASFDADRPESQSSENSAATDLAREADRFAGAGQFAKAAQQMRAAARAARRERESHTEMSADERRQRERLEQQMQLTAGLLADLARDEDVRRSVRMQAQSELASAVPPLAAELETLARQVRLPQVGLQDERPAVEAAQQAARVSGQAAVQADQALRNGRIQDGLRQAQAAEAGLQRLKNLAQQAAGDHPAEGTVPQVPREVGQHVTEALDHLSQADPTNGESTDPGPQNAMAENAVQDDPGQGAADQQTQADDAASDVSAQRSGNRTGTGLSGDASSASSGGTSGRRSDSDDSVANAGQPGGTTGTGDSVSKEQAEQLAAAAEALSNAAMRSLPRLETLRAVSGTEGGWSVEPTGPDPASERLSEAAPGRPAESQRQWARLNEELAGGVLSGESEEGDQRYENRIRAYFRELARRTAQRP